jgi:hypothetical protein
MIFIFLKPKGNNGVKQCLAEPPKAFRVLMDDLVESYLNDFVILCRVPLVPGALSKITSLAMPPSCCRISSKQDLPQTVIS